jgi:hypothetical protein
MGVDESLAVRLQTPLGLLEFIFPVAMEPLQQDRSVEQQFAHQ